MSQSARHRKPRELPAQPTPEERAAERAARVARLPQWAQRELYQLQRQVEHWREVAEAGTDAAGDSDTYLVHYGGPDRAITKGLGNGATVRFRLHSGGAYVEARLDKSGTALRVTSHPFGVVVRPVVHNAIHVEVNEL